MKAPNDIIKQVAHFLKMKISQLDLLVSHLFHGSVCLSKALYFHERILPFVYQITLSSYILCCLD